MKVDGVKAVEAMSMPELRLALRFQQGANILHGMVRQDDLVNKGERFEDVLTREIRSRNPKICGGTQC